MFDLQTAACKSVDHTPSQVTESDPSVRVVVMEGAGDKAYCAGGDIRGTAASLQ